MNKLVKILLGVASILPFIAVVSYAVFVGIGEKTRSGFWMALVLAAIICVPVLLIFYIVNVYRNNTVPKNQKHLWSALLFLGNIWVYMFYWYLHIWREAKRS